MEISGNLSQGHKSPVPVTQEVRLAPGPVSAFRRIENFFVSAGMRDAERTADELLFALDVKCRPAHGTVTNYQ